MFMVQEQQGYVSANAMRHVARGDRLHAGGSRRRGVVLRDVLPQPVGKYVVQVCRTLSCALKGAERVTEEIGQALGIRVGETDKTGTFTLIEVECLGACDRAPVVMVNDGWHEQASSRELLEADRTTSRLVARPRSVGVIYTWNGDNSQTANAQLPSIRERGATWSFGSWEIGSWKFGNWELGVGS